MCTLDVQIVWIYRKFEYPNLRKFIKKLWTVYIQPTQIYREYEFCGYIQCTKLHKYNGKLCTLDVRIVWISQKFVCPKLR